MSIAEREDTLAPPSLLRVQHDCKSNPEEEEGEYYSDKNSVDLLSPIKKRVNNPKAATTQSKISAAKTNEVAVVREAKT